MAKDSQIYTGLFNDSFFPVRDGVAVAVENYARWLPEHGMNPLVVTPWNSPRPDVAYPIVRYLSLPVVSRRPYRFGLHFLDPFVWHRVRSTRFDLVHAHCPFSSGRLARYAAHKQGVPLIATFHSKFRSDLEHSFHGREYLIDKVLKNVIEFFDSCDEVWIPQQEVEDTIREYGFKGPVSVVPNGNDMASLIQGDLHAYKSAARERIGIPKDKLALLFVGQHIFEKGLPLIVNTLVELKKRNIPILINFVGTGYALDWLKQQVVEQGLSDIATINGPIQDRNRLSDFYAGSDLLFFPSPYDNAPLVVREAAAMGTASLLLKGSTAARIARDGEDVFLCTNNPSECASLIVRLQADRSLIEKIGRQCHASLSRPWRDIIGEVSDRYRAAIARKNK